MNSPQEESQVLHHRGAWPRPIGKEELEKLKVAIATKEEFPVDSDNAFSRTSEEWVGMEEILSDAHVFILHSQREAVDVYRVLIIVKSNLFNADVWKFHTEDMSDIEHEYDTQGGF